MKIEEILEQAKDAKVDLSGVAKRFIQRMEDRGGFDKEIYDGMVASEAGSAVHQRYCHMGIRLLELTDQGAEKAELAKLDDEELRDLAAAAQDLFNATDKPKDVRGHSEAEYVGHAADEEEGAVAGGTG